jgi:hypothetical protein
MMQRLTSGKVPQSCEIEKNQPCSIAKSNDPMGSVISNKADHFVAYEHLMVVLLITSP